MYQLSLGDVDYIEQLLDMRVSSLGLGQLPIDKVDETLCFKYMTFVGSLDDKR